MHEKETLAARAEALAAAARLDAIRSRLNPHFLFNALHTLSALVKFRPDVAENAIERLGDMLRYTLKEDGRELVEFTEEYDFTRQYLAFEQLRYEDRFGSICILTLSAVNSTCPRFPCKHRLRMRCCTPFPSARKAVRYGYAALARMAG